MHAPAAASTAAPCKLLPHRPWLTGAAPAAACRPPLSPATQLCPGSKVKRYVQCAAADTPAACAKVKAGCAWSDSTAYDNSTLSYIIGGRGGPVLEIERRGRPA
jgi:hypothetical protein